MGLKESYLVGVKVGRVCRMEGKEEEGRCVGIFCVETFRIEVWEFRVSFFIILRYFWRGVKVF